MFNNNVFTKIANNFLYLKDVVFEAQNSKETFYKYYEINQTLGKINRLSYKEEGVNLEDTFEVNYL